MTVNDDPPKSSPSASLSTASKAMPSITQMSISVSLIAASNTIILDLHKNNWMEWSHQIDQTLCLSGLGGYIDRHIKAPDASLNPTGYNNWVSNTKAGPLAQITLIEDTFTTHYSASEPYAVTSEHLAQLVHHIWAIGIPTEELFISIIMLNALSPHLPNVWDHITMELAKATDTSPLTPAVIQTHLVFKQQLVNHAKATPSNVNVLAVQTQTGAVCTHCKCKGHLVASCWGPGSPMEGRCDEVLTAKAAKWTGKGCSSAAATATSSAVLMGAQAVKHYNASSKTYLLDPVTQIAYLCESTPTELASLASVTVNTTEATVPHVDAAPMVTMPEWLAGDCYDVDSPLFPLQSSNCLPLSMICMSQQQAPFHQPLHMSAGYPQAPHPYLPYPPIPPMPPYSHLQYLPPILSYPYPYPSTHQVPISTAPPNKQNQVHLTCLMCWHDHELSNGVAPAHPSVPAPAETQPPDHPGQCPPPHPKAWKRLTKLFANLSESEINASKELQSMVCRHIWEAVRISIKGPWPDPKEVQLNDHGSTYYSPDFTKGVNDPQNIALLRWAQLLTWEELENPKTRILELNDPEIYWDQATIFELTKKAFQGFTPKA
ncbi:hypothetical protein NEOLEDRAFT_1180688 [Neolentinus lepideus HHB14362 ss-1]|uniref:Uncharacterized protein n=1 Tax=Neolentinus lepideus HHB14362 ss-1 TaxID=1314782 RepID=A0A165QRQ6_9AGAM|nr:hypothetical protein NEOLEDRAFT_1180688 [Neolentinus lepideus HHB14362 ss-1]